jgi:hypothetical protein
MILPIFRHFENKTTKLLLISSAFSSSDVTLVIYHKNSTILVIILKDFKFWQNIIAKNQIFFTKNA